MLRPITLHSKLCTLNFIAALLCLVCTSPVWGQPNMSLISLVETGLVRNTGMIYMIVPGPVNGQPGQGEYYLVFYVGVVNPSPGVVAHTHGMLAVRKNNGIFSVVPAIPYRDSGTGNIVMATPFAPDLARGNDNLIFYTRHDVENWYRSFNNALGMLPATLAEFQAVMGNSRDYQFTLMQPRDVHELALWDDLFGIEPPCPPVVPGWSPNVPPLLRGILFLLCFACGTCFFVSFIESFERGSL